jgi:uncharacterized damage-inducible protein DinB
VTTWIDQYGRPRPPDAGDETTLLLGFLDLQRATLAWKTRGLDAAGLRATVGASSMTLGGLLKHLAAVEDYWCSRWLRGNPAAEPWASAPPDDGADWSWTSAAADTPEQLHALWNGAVERSRAYVAEALAEGGLDGLAKANLDGPPQPTPNLRWILLHLIEEYARHVGHADLLRESVDGEVGE